MGMGRNMQIINAQLAAVRFYLRLANWLINKMSALRPGKIELKSSRIINNLPAPQFFTFTQAGFRLALHEFAHFADCLYISISAC